MITPTAGSCNIHSPVLCWLKFLKHFLDVCFPAVEECWMNTVTQVVPCSSIATMSEAQTAYQFEGFSL